MVKAGSFIGVDGGVIERVISGDNGGSNTIKSSSDHLSNGTEEFELFVSGGSSSFVLLSEGIAHFDREVEEVGVSADLLFGFGNKEFFLKDALGHLFKVVFEVLLVLLEVSDGLLEFGFKSVVGVLSDVLFLIIISKGVLDVREELVEHSSYSFNGTLVEEHINFRSSHLGEKSNDWSV